MVYFQAVKPNHVVKLCQHTVEVVYNVIPGIEHVAGIEAHAHVVGERYAVQNFTEFLKMRAISVPLPAMVSSKTVVVCFGR